VREGARRAEVSAEFDSPPSLRPWLEEAGFAVDDVLLLRRVVEAASATARRPAAAAAPGSMAARPRWRNCVKPPTTWWTSTASTPGKA
jgi:hypothetical protein